MGGDLHFGYGDTRKNAGFDFQLHGIGQRIEIDVHPYTPGYFGHRFAALGARDFLQRKSKFFRILEHGWA